MRAGTPGPRAEAPQSCTVGGVYTPPMISEVRIGKWLDDGWTTISSDMQRVIPATLVFVILSLSVVMLAPMIIGMHVMLLRKAPTGRLDLTDLFCGLNYFLPSLAATLVVGIFIAIGMLACVIPGLVVGAMYLFTYLFIADRKMEFWPAMQASRAIVKQNYLGFTFFFVTLILLTVVGAALCGVGLLVTLPLCFASVNAAYRDLVGESNPSCA